MGPAQLNMGNRKTALVTGAEGQDAYFLSRSLARNGIRVVGVKRPGGVRVVPRAHTRFFDDLIEVDLGDCERVGRLVSDLAPEFILNFGAIAGSLTQQTDPQGLLRVNVGAVAAFLEALRVERAGATFVQASSSEVFAGGSASPQGLDTPRVPRTIYGVTKIASDGLVRLYRETHGISCHSVILFSHESPLRKDSFFSRRIVAQAFDVAEGKRERIVVHSPDAVRDWGYAGEYCHAIVVRLLAGRMTDMVLGSGIRTTVREFAQAVCRETGLDYDARVDEAPLQEGRADEGVAVVADPRAPGFCMQEGVRFGVARLVRLLVRCERRRRAIPGST